MFKDAVNRKPYDLNGWFKPNWPGSNDDFLMITPDVLRCENIQRIRDLPHIKHAKGTNESVIVTRNDGLEFSLEKICKSAVDDPGVVFPITFHALVLSGKGSVADLVKAQSMMVALTRAVDAYYQYRDQIKELQIRGKDINILAPALVELEVELEAVIQSFPSLIQCL